MFNSCPSWNISSCYTDTHTDVDLYVACSGYLKWPCPSTSDDIDITTSSNFFNNQVNIINFTSSTESLSPLPLITVKFQEPVVREPSTSFLDFFGLYVLCTFDLPISRVALRFTIRNSNIDVHYINASGTATQFVVAHEARIKTYEARRLRDVS